MRWLVIVFILFFYNNLYAEDITVTFLTNKVKIPLVRKYFGTRYKVKNLKSFIEDTKLDNCDALLSNLKDTKESLHLNDYLYNQLIGEVVNVLYSGYNEDFKNAYIGYLLEKSGYKVFIAYYKQILLFVCSSEFIYNRNSFRSGKNLYFCLNAKRIKDLQINSEDCYELNGQSGKNFSFSADVTPITAEPEILNYKVRLFDGSIYHELQYNLNKTLIDAYNGYPLVELGAVSNTELSKEAYSSLISELKRLVDGKDQKTSVKILLSFVRKLGTYKFDTEVYGTERWFRPEEALYYEYKDCDDYSILFYYLVKTVLDLPVIIIQYPGHEHVNVGVELEQPIGMIYTHKEKIYTICEPTDSLDNQEFCTDTSLVKVKNKKILAEYNPKN
ncbi:hypothetical protein QNI16_36500 [Cytophagaceae bacterium YF14B1]|uniref:Transglutaminase-like domain-containing protein n=1 Tax=Xanthocytophaga flava TaxID=3048013 RepID=A0AAE3QZL7_9BACT|nr:hypothetical protein [Xanthocytophaga flavus]MDJ1486040.1 hypothetical protein [Xanthocytophaga flavus]